MTATRRVPIVLSVNAVMQQWARQEDAPAGAALIATTEIAGRLRGGVEWRRDGAVSVGVLARPAALDPSEVELAWLAASLGAASALDVVTGGRHECVWPDRVVPAATGVVDEGDGGIEVVVAPEAQLGPGRVDHIVLIVRVAGLGEVADEAGHGLVAELRAAARLLDEPAALVDQYRQRCSTLGRQVSTTLLPRGSIRGRARDLDRSGALLVESPTGLVEAVAVATLGRLEVIDS